nr:hypothetical protein [Tanacetum cinerariifolium]
CGIDLRDEICPLCNSMNSCTYDPTPNSFDCALDSYHSPHPTYETYSYDSYGNDSQFGYDCQPQFPLNYDSEQGYNENYTSYLYDSSNEVIKSSVENLVPIPSESEGIPEHMCGVPFHDNSSPLNVSKDQFEDFFESNNEVSSIDDDSFSIDNINYVEASPPDFELVSSEVMEIVIPEVGGIDDDIPLTIKDDNLREKLLNVNLLIATIEALNDNPTPSSDYKTKSSSTSLNSLLEETNTFHNSFLEFENFYFDLGEISSGSTTTHSDISLPDYKLSISMTIILKRSVGELMSVLNFGIRENPSTTLVNLPIEDDYSPLLAYVVWIFVAYLMYPVIPPYLHPFRNEDTIFDPGITINRIFIKTWFISSVWSFQEIQYSPQSLE